MYKVCVDVMAQMVWRGQAARHARGCNVLLCVYFRDFVAVWSCFNGSA